MKIDYSKIKFNRKQLGITLILIGLMVVMLSGGEIFKDKLKEVALVETNMNIMKLISYEEPRISYSIPEDWESVTKSYPSDNIKYYAEYTSKENTINGYVKIFNGGAELTKIIKDDKNLLKGSYTLEDYEIDTIDISNGTAKLVSYIFYNDKREGFVAKEYYINKGENTVVMSFYILKDKYRDNMLIAFQTILESLTIE